VSASPARLAESDRNVAEREQTKRRASGRGQGGDAPMPVGRVLGTLDSMPLEFWVGVAEGEYLQLDDVVVVETPLPDGRSVRLFGVVDLVRARHEGARFDSDVFLIEQGVLPAQVAQAAHVRVTRVEPEVFVPPLPGQAVARARGVERDQALFFDGMERRLPIGLSRDGEPVFANLDFLDGSRGAHVNISGISGVATKTTYATFLLHSMFKSGALGAEAASTHAIVFNVKGEDLLFLDQPNERLREQDRADYARLGLDPGPFESVQLLAPVAPGSRERLPATGSRQQGVQAFFWTLRELVAERLLRFLFAETEDATSQLAFVVDKIEAKLVGCLGRGGRTDAWIEVEGERLESFEALVELLTTRDPEAEERSLAERWAYPAAPGTVAAFERRLHAAANHVGHLLRGSDVGRREDHRLDWRRRQLSVVDVHALHDRAQRFVVGAVLKRMFEDKEALGTSRPLVFVVLDELNKYAPRDGSGPIKEVLLDISERGRSLGVILVGAQQTASQVEGRIVANAALRVVGRLDTAEAERPEYGFLSAAGRGRAGILKPGTMIVQQPEIPAPLLVRFPFPAWATRKSEVSARPSEAEVFRGFTDD
jgi:DNA helicase HerA-like ATPase